jgi:hypothetical protein
MALAQAKQFILRLQRDVEFRSELYTIKDVEKAESFVKSNGYSFSATESEDAYRELLLKCYSEEEAHDLRNVFFMYQLMFV